MKVGSASLSRTTRARPRQRRADRHDPMAGSWLVDPGRPGPAAALLGLLRVHGNRSVARMLERPAAAPAGISPLGVRVIRRKALMSSDAFNVRVTGDADALLTAISIAHIAVAADAE